MSEPVAAARAGDDGTIARATLIAALSRALDLTEGQPMGHSVRSCWVGMQIAEEIGLDAARSADLYYALLLKDAGCTANAASVSDWFANDDRAVKRDLKRFNWSRYDAAARFAMKNARPGAPVLPRLAQIARLARLGRRAARELVVMRCTRGADVVRSLGWVDLAPEAVLNLDEHWDGSGNPHGLRGPAIPLLARIALLAQQIEIFWAEGGPGTALAMARARRGTWFDPDLVDALAARARRRAFWHGLSTAGDPHQIAGLDPEPQRLAVRSDASLQAVARTFAAVVDAKSPWTARHSWRTSAYAGAIAARLGYDDEGRRRVELAGLFHDIGKLGVSNRVLDKPGPLDPEERAHMNRHADLTHRILAPLAPLREVAEAAACHHERLDGSGYVRGLAGDAVPADAMVVAAADVFDALTARRPYREPLEPDRALAILDADARTRLPEPVVLALREAVRDGDVRPQPADAQPAG